MRPTLSAVAGVLTVLLFASMANADEAPDNIRAAALFAEGRRLMAVENYDAACPKLAESQALDPAPDTAFDLGICRQKESQAAFKVAHDLGRASESSRTAGLERSVALRSETDAQRRGDTQRVVGLAIGGVGVLGLAVGVITAVMAKSAWDQATATCGTSQCANNASQLAAWHQLSVVWSISLLAGGATAGAGAIVFFTAPKSKTSTGSAVGLGPAAEGTGLAVVGRF